MRECANGMPRPCRGRDAAWHSAKAAIRHQHGDDLGQLARRCRGDARIGCRALAGARTPQDPTKSATYHQHGDDLGRLARRCRGDARMGCRALAGAGTPHGALQRRRPAVSIATISVSSHAAAASGQLFETKAGFLRALLPARKYRPCSGEAVQTARQDFAVSASPAEAALISEYASPRGCSRGSASPAEAAVTAQRDGQRVAVLRPLSLRKWRSLRSATDRVAVLRPLSLRKRRLLRSATDSGSRFFVHSSCGSGAHCATRASSAARSASLARMA